MFLISKMIGVFVSPLNIVLVLMVIGVVAGRWWIGRACRWLALVVALVVSFTPLSDVMVRSLESRAAQAELGDLSAYAGAIVLGGAQGSGAVAEAHDTYLLEASAERLTTAVELRAIDPQFPLIFAGGSGAVVPRGWNEAEVTREFLSAMGIDPDSARYEDRSRNTAENARLVSEMLGAVEGEEARPWLLVTSALHMPRAMMIFDDTMISYVPAPVDFQQGDDPLSFLGPRPLDRFVAMRAALHEHVGMLYYRLLQRR